MSSSLLFNQLNRPKQHGLRDREAKGLRGRQIDDELKFGRFQTGQPIAVGPTPTLTGGGEPAFIRLTRIRLRATKTWITPQTLQGP